MNKIYDAIALFIIAIVVTTVLSLFGVWSLSFAIIAEMLTYMVTLNSANDFVEVACDKNAIGQVSRSYFNKMIILLFFSGIMLATAANPVIIGVASLIIYAL